MSQKIVTNPRCEACVALRKIDGGMTAQEALNQVSANLSHLDRQLCNDLVYGLLRNRQVIDAKLAKLLRRPERLPPLILIALKLALYALLCQDRAPQYAVVNETVSLAKSLADQKMANLANAVLRRFIRERKKSTSAIGAKSIRLPQEITDLWTAAYGGNAAAALMERSLRRPWSAWRFNAANPEAENLSAILDKPLREQKITASGYAFPPGQAPGLLAGRTISCWIKKGLLSRQAAGSQIIMAELGLCQRWRDMPVWDACAGFGGKTCLMLEEGLHVVLASDASYKRLLHLPAECRRLGLPLPGIILADARRPPSKSWSGHILVDAPCSGLGVLARRPDLIGRWSMANTLKLIELQKNILNSLVALLGPGSQLAYITCTLNPAENEDQVAALLAANPDLQLLRSWQTPHEHPWLEGMYGAVIVKNG